VNADPPAYRYEINDLKEKTDAEINC